MRNLTIWFRPDGTLIIETWQGNEKDEFVLPAEQVARLHFENVRDMHESSHAVHFHKEIHNIVAAGTAPEGLAITHLNKQRDLL